MESILANIVLCVLCWFSYGRKSVGITKGNIATWTFSNTNMVLALRCCTGIRLANLLRGRPPHGSSLFTFFFFWIVLRCQVEAVVTRLQPNKPDLIFGRD